jgi:hypothetical protein
MSVLVKKPDWYYSTETVVRENDESIEDETDEMSETIKSEASNEEMT